MILCFFESYRYLFFLVCLLSFLSEQARGERCVIGGVEGECVPLPECEQLVSLLKNSSSTEEGLRTSRDWRCGLGVKNTKVCCPVEGKDPMTLSRIVEDTANGSDLFVDAFPDHDVCGWTDEDRSIKEIRRLTDLEIETGYHKVIANGIPVVSRDMARYMALLGYKDDFVQWSCGGSVITEKHVLTAAHCIRDNLYVVRVGELDLALEEEDAGPIDFYVKKMIPHEQYSMYHNDIGIVVLDGRVNFKQEHHVGPICLPLNSRKFQPTDFQPYYGEGAGIFVAGWGEAPEMRTRPTWLAYTRVNIIDDKSCKKLYQSSNRTIDERVFCAGDRVRQHDACNGDSGGPIVAEYEVPELNRTFFYQLGVISYGYQCSAGMFTGVYTNVTHFLPWIQEKVSGTAP